MRRPLLWLSTAVLLLFAGAAGWWLWRARGGGATGPVRRGAGVLLVTIDTLRADALGFAGNRIVATPVLDRLAAAGRMFDDAHAHNVITLPSHTNILTGLYPFQHGVRDNSGFVLDAKFPTLASRLKAAGYATAAFVGAYPLDARYGLNRGFDVYDDKFPRGSNLDAFVIAERRGDQVVAPALAWWQAHREKKRFLWVHLYDPHAAYAPPEPFATRFRDNPYLGEVAAVDSFLGPLLEPLLAGAEPPTLVVVTGDHGESLGEHGELTHGLFAYEATLKIPLVVWGAGVTPGKDSRPARHVDIVPTVLSYLGLRPPAELPGRSLLAPPLAATARQDSYFEALSTSLNRGWAPLRGLLRERRKVIDLPLPELYDLGRDPKEETNLFPTETRAARTLERALPAESVWPPQKGASSADEEARLRSLGYAGGGAQRKSRYGPEDDPKTLIGIDQKLHQVIDAYSRGRFAEAAALAREVIREQPKEAEAYENLALSLRQLERHGEAVEVLRQAQARGADNASIRRQLGQALSEAGKPAEAIAVLEPLAKVERPDVSVLNAYGVSLADAGRFVEAVAVLERAVSLFPSDPKALENLGIVTLRQERAADARRYLERALALNPSLPISWNTLGVALYQLEGPVAALDAWEHAAALDSRQLDALFNIGLVAAHLGRNDQARRALERYVKTAPPAAHAADLTKARALLVHLGR
jgi:arylsulfatase A-like enzyme/Flp pilus assembly protein TadD